MENDNHPLTNDTYDTGDHKPPNDIEPILGAVWDYHLTHPDQSFGEIIQRIVGLARPVEVKNDFYLKWLKASK